MTGTRWAWTIVCVVCAVAYNAFVIYVTGGNHYEMLVSGNIKRTSVYDRGGEYKFSSHKYAREYRPWKGFVIGAFIGIFTILTGIIFGCNQTAIDEKSMGKGVAVLMIVFFLLSGWSILPFYYMNGSGIYVNYFASCLFALVPIAVTGGMYIAGAYGKRRKVIREQELADRAAAAEAQREKKINYGGLPGTKPRKRK